MKPNMTIEDLANWFLSKEPMTHKKLQKLCYYAVAWGYALMDKAIVSNDEFEAWVHGPVSPTLYAKYKSNGWNLINLTEKVPEPPKDVDELLQSVWETYGEKSGNELEAISHSETPWKKAREGLDDDERGNAKISVSEMKAFYQSIYSGDFKNESN